MSSAAYLTSQLVNCFDPAQRERIYLSAEALYGKNFADHLRDQIESHHMIVENERLASATTGKQTP